MTRPRNLRKTTAKPDYYLPAKETPTPRKKKRLTKTARMSKKRPPAKKESKTESYEVESILGHKQQGKRMLFEVKWKGYEETTWEPKSNLNKRALADALAQLEGKEEPKAAAAETADANDKES